MKSHHAVVMQLWLSAAKMPTTDYRSFSMHSERSPAKRFLSLAIENHRSSYSSSRLLLIAGYRRSQALTPCIAPLSFNVPPPIEQQNAVDRMAAKQIELRIKKREHTGYSSDSSSGSESNIGSNEDFTLASHGEVNSRQNRRADKAERKRAKKKEKKARKEERRSEKQVRKGEKGKGVIVRRVGSWRKNRRWPRRWSISSSSR